MVSKYIPHSIAENDVKVTVKSNVSFPSGFVIAAGDLPDDKSKHSPDRQYVAGANERCVMAIFVLDGSVADQNLFLLTDDDKPRRSPWSAAENATIEATYPDGRTVRFEGCFARPYAREEFGRFDLIRYTFHFCRARLIDAQIANH